MPEGRERGRGECCEESDFDPLATGYPTRSPVLSVLSSVGSRFDAVGELKAEDGIPRTVDRGPELLLEARRCEEIREVLLYAREHHERASCR